MNVVKNFRSGEGHVFANCPFRRKIFFSGNFINTSSRNVDATNFYFFCSEIK